MIFLPIVARELRVAARRPVTYWVRSGAALVILGLGGWLFLMLRHEAPPQIAKGLFWIMTGGAVFYCLLSGVWFTADCLSREKREGTLGLLFLTDLKGYDVVLGKLAATSLNCLYAALAVVPMLALPLLMGGVTLGEFGRMALVLVNTLFFSLALGMAVSALGRSSRQATATTFLLLLVLTALLPALGVWRAAATGSSQMDRAWLLASVGFSYSRAADLPYSAQPQDFWSSLAVLHGLGWFCLCLASIFLPRAWQERPPGAGALRWRTRWRQLCYGQACDRAGFRQRLLDRGAYCWLASRVRVRPALVWAALGLIACGWFWGLARVGRDWLNVGTYIVTGLLLCVAIKILFGLDAGRQLAEDRSAGTLELLLTTPLTVRDVLRGQGLALRRQFEGPVIVVLIVCFLFMMLGAATEMSQLEPEDRTLWFSVWTAAVVLLIADLGSLFWYGMWQGLRARSSARAATGNLVTILLLPWAGMALVVFTLAVVQPNAAPMPLEFFLLGCYSGLSLATDFGFALWARHKLLTEFRLEAARRYEPPVGFWRRFLGDSRPRGAEPPQPASR
jgi:hypothetical protein